MKNTPKSIARISRGASSIADNTKAFNESLGAQAAITVLKIIKNVACARCKKPEYGKGVGNAFNSSDGALRTQIWPARPFRGCR